LVKSDANFKKVTNKPLIALCYLGDQKIANHNNSEQQDIIVQVLNSLGFEVHLIKHEKHLIANLEYDYSIGFGMSWRSLLNNPKIKKKILYATEAPPFLAYLNEARLVSRANIYELKKYKIERAFRFYTDDDYLKADAILQMGDINSNIIRGIQAFRNTPIYNISTYGIGSDITKKKNKIRKNFIWFGSQGAIHKGLNETMIAFQNILDVKLYVAGCAEIDFNALNPFKNVIYTGVLDVKSEKFTEIIDDCIGFVLPSASEGISTAAITCMYRGLIPIVTQETNVLIRHEYIASANSKDIEIAVKKLLQMTDSQLLSLSEENRTFCLNAYNKLIFKNSLAAAFSDLLV
jgi:hypothetical protein